MIHSIGYISLAHYSRLQLKQLCVVRHCNYHSTVGLSVPSSLLSSRMRFMNHNWSATKQRLHPQSVAEISRHSVLSGDPGQDSTMRDIVRVTRTQISVCKSPFPSAATTVSLFRAKTVQQRPLLPREGRNQVARLCSRTLGEN